MATILLIDDDVDLVEMNRLVLAHRGHKVLAAYSAAEARGVLGHSCPDLVVLDVMMESLTAGLDLARELCRQCPRLPVLVLTGFEQATGRKPSAEGLEDVRFLDKPLAPAALADEIENTLKTAKRTK